MARRRSNYIPREFCHVRSSLFLIGRFSYVKSDKYPVHRGRASSRVAKIVQSFNFDPSVINLIAASQELFI